MDQNLIWNGVARRFLDYSAVRVIDNVQLRTTDGTAAREGLEFA
jgi:hypothetical protein